MKTWRYIVAGLVIGAGLSGGTLLLWSGIRRTDAPTELSPTDGRRLLELVMERVERSWVDSLATDEIFRRTALGLVAELDDPNSEYLSPEHLKRLREATTGTYSGVGMSIDRRDGWLVITHVRLGTPAEHAGLTIGDRIVEINGQSLRNYTPAEARTAIRGTPGTSLALVIERGNTTARIPLRIEREEIHVSAVTRASLLQHGVGYFMVSTFNDSTAHDVERTVDSLIAIGAQRLIIDMRGNPGGLLTQGVEVADLFLDKGVHIASTKGRIASANVDYVDKAPQRWAGRPIIILVNGNTASAAEVVAGALQDHDRALVVGRQTYGKGSAQAVLQLENGGALKLTSARWYTPLGRSIERPHVLSRDGEDVDTVVARYLTPKGRMMTGGGGIHPDIVAGDSALSPAERAWVRAIGTRVTVFRSVLAAQSMRIVRAGGVRDPLFTIDPAMRDGLYAAMSAGGVDLPRGIFDDARSAVDRVLGQEVARIAFGIPGAQQRAVRTDPLVGQAVTLLAGVETADALFGRVPRAGTTESSF